MAASSKSCWAFAERDKINVATARRWQGRDDAQDRSHRPYTLATTWSAGQDLLVVALRRTLLLPLDDMLATTHQIVSFKN